MKAALISNGSISSQMILEEMKKLFEETEQILLNKIEICAAGKEAGIYYEGKKLKKYDCIYARGSHKYATLLRSITSLTKNTYLPLVDSAFTISHNKLLTHLALQKSGIDQPTTYLASNLETAKDILKRITYPIIIKVPAGTHGKGVMIADSYESASSMLDALSLLNQQFILQEFINTNGTDIRAIVIGDKVVAAMQRKATKGEARANIHAGGCGEKILLDNQTKKIAIDTAQAIGAEICAVDILPGPKGPLVLEINASPGIQGITKTTKINIAEKIAKFLHEKTKEKQEKGGKKIIKEEIGSQQQIISNLDFRGERILLPKLATIASKFSDKKDVIITAKKGSILIEEEKI
jgi:ribosomal protein S6--L-glutamate ligase